MKLRASHVVIAAMAIVIAALSWALVYALRERLNLEPEEYEATIKTTETAGVENGRAVVHVSPASQAASGIKTQPLAAAKRRESVEIYGTVVNIQPLLELRGRYLAAQAQLRADTAAQAAARSEYQRMQRLYHDDRNVSEQSLRNAEARYREAQAQHGAATAAVAALRDALVTGWGTEVADWASARESKTLGDLLAQRAQLVQLAFPYEFSDRVAKSSIDIAPASGGATRPARFVSRSPQIDAALPGQTFFYLVQDASLRAGSRVIAAVGTGAQVLEGVLVPNEAVVWHAGKPWVYLRQNADTFARYALSASRDLGGDWFSRDDDLVPGREAVVSGAQLLLSEELKFQIRNENED